MKVELRFGNHPCTTPTGVDSNIYIAGLWSKEVNGAAFIGHFNRWGGLLYFIPVHGIMLRHKTIKEVDIMFKEILSDPELYNKVPEIK